MAATEAMTGGHCSLIAGNQPSELSGFPGEPESGTTNVPTDLILDEHGNLLKWGHEARAFMEEDDFDPEQHIGNVKMFLEPGQREIIERRATLSGVSISDIVKLGIKAPITFLLNDSDSPI